MTDRITLAHGSGGRAMQKLINQLFLRYFDNEYLASQEDQARIAPELLKPGETLAYSTDSFVVDPIFFPGGDIGKLAICGTANDIAMCGARPRFLSCAYILEEGLALTDLERIVSSMADATRAADLQIVTGDTKVVPRGAADKIFINTSGLGAIPAALSWGADQIRPGDQVLVSGTLGDHGATILNLREGLGFDGQLCSDCQHLYPLVEALLPIAGVRALRDATRGGVNAILHEFSAICGCGFAIEEARLPVSDAVRGICELLGLEPVNFANEGKLVAVVASEDLQRSLTALQQTPGGAEAAWIGEVNDSGKVTLKNCFGASRWLDLPSSEPMPRIC